MRASERLRRSALIIMAGLAVAGGASAQQQEDPQARLRAALRDATVRIRQLEDENATLQAKQAELDRDRQAAVQKASQSDKELQGLRGHAASDQQAQQQASEAQKETLAKWEAAYKDAATIAQTRDADAKNMEAALVALREKDRLAEEENDKLFKLGQELIDLYQNKSMLDALGDEPVTKLKRVEYENVVQDYQDKLRDSHVTYPAAR
jgi:hypothetical protein